MAIKTIAINTAALHLCAVRRRNHNIIRVGFLYFPGALTWGLDSVDTPWMAMASGRHESTGPSAVRNRLIQLRRTLVRLRQHSPLAIRDCLHTRAGLGQRSPLIHLFCFREEAPLKLLQAFNVYRQPRILRDSVLAPSCFLLSPALLAC